MKKVIVVLLVMLGSSQITFGQMVMPSEVKSMIIDLTKQLDSEKDTKVIETKITELLSNAPNAEMKKEALKLILENTSSAKVRKHAEKVLSRNNVKKDKKKSKYSKRFEDMFTGLDKNEDGFLVKEEVPNQYKSQFETIDANGDKKISKEELVKVF
ncbi:hypothetical protein [uncultured Tenacibaculum sp.]|uniref:hypothetical protein n=1 Tax=uncultured Tenacibaculum sp. TaxID=174713 RepID=UPI002604D3DF|nr:hypothetical protein [uncultured Tenacibaculum sp.]